MKFNVEDYENGKEFEVANKDESINLTTPTRTTDTYQYWVDIVNERAKISEYDYYKKVLELFYGKNTFKEIEKICKKNLDAIMNVTLYSEKEFVKYKEDAEQAEMERNAERFSPLTDKIRPLTPILNTIK